MLKNQSKKYRNIFVKLYSKNELIKFEDLLLSISKKFRFVLKLLVVQFKHEFLILGLTNNKFKACLFIVGYFA